MVVQAPHNKLDPTGWGTRLDPHVSWWIYAMVGGLFSTYICIYVYVALGDMDLRFAWQALHLLTWTFVLRGRRGAWRHGLAFRVAGVAVGDIDLRFAWQVWHLWDWATRAWRPWRLWRHSRFAWQAWHLATWTFVLRGRRGTWRHGLAFRVAGVALGDIDPRFAWQAWHLWAWAARSWRPWRPWRLWRLWRLWHRRRFAWSHTHTLLHTPSFIAHLLHAQLSHTTL